MEDRIFRVIKDIPLKGGGSIQKDMHIHLVNGVFYSEFGPFDVNMRLSFRNLLQRSDWQNYLKVLKK